MLDIFRKKSGSWLIKLMFVLIVLSFVFFFGYTRMQKGMGGSGIAARVNGTVITSGKYRLAVENTTELYKNMFKDGMPENMQDQVRQTALFQLIGTTLLEQYAKKMGLMVTDEELFDAIITQPNFQTDGEFNRQAYKGFLNYFERKYNVSYEDLMREEILANKARDLLLASVNISDQEVRDAFNQEKTSWKFERVKIAENAPEGVTYDISADEIAKNAAAAMKANSKKDLDNLVGKYKAELTNLDDITIQKKTALLPDTADAASVEKVYKLTKEGPVTEEPIKAGGALYVFRLTEEKKPSDEEWTKEKETYIPQFKENAKQQYLYAWQESLRKQAKIEQYVLDERK